MAEFVLILGKSGSGKSRSLLNFKDDEIVFINVTGKRLPIRGKKFKYECKTTDVNTIKTWLAKMPCKAAVIDDMGYLQTTPWMIGIKKPKGGASQFDLYNDIGYLIWDLIMFIKNQLPEDVIVYCMMHEETNDYGDTKPKTIGKLLDQKVCIEGLSSIVLRCASEGKSHFFLTHTDGGDVTKTPEGLFEQDRIDNDLKAVDTAIRDYYGMNEENQEDEKK